MGGGEFRRLTADEKLCSRNGSDGPEWNELLLLRSTIRDSVTDRQLYTEWMTCHCDDPTMDLTWPRPSPQIKSSPPLPRPEQNGAAVAESSIKL